MSSVGTTVNMIIDRVLAPAFLLACIVLGGSSAAGAVANATLQLAGVLILLLLIGSGRTRGMAPAARSLLLICVLAAALLLLQLLPLPPSIWMLLPGRGRIADGFRLAGAAPPWLPISLLPDGTIAALLSLLPPSAMFLATTAASPLGRRSAVYVLVCATAASILIGILQQIHAINYFYAFTSFGGAVGFFANRNHLATLCLMTMPFAAALAISGVGAGLDRRIGRRLIAGSAIALMTVGVLAVESMAGWIFLAPSLIGCLLVYERGERGALRRRTAWIAAAAVALGLVAAVAASLSIGDLSQQASGIRPRERRESMRLSLDAARDFLPVGSGAGSFVSLYPSYENPANASTTYVNHAHSDYIELLLEGGLPAVLLLGAFLLWWVRRFRPAWRPGSEAGSFARAGFLAIAVPLAHSLVDYPLRTAAIAAVAAMALAMLVAADGERSSSPRPRSRRHGAGVEMIVLTRPSEPGAVLARS